MQKIRILDTTLRDGTQGTDISLTVRDKVELVKAFDNFGIDYIELGWPWSNKKEVEAFREAGALKLKQAKIVAFGSTKRIGIDAKDDKNLLAIVESKAAVACIFGKTWIEHIKKQLKTTEEENLKAIEDSIKFLKSRNLEVMYDAEHYFDGFKDNSKYALKTLECAVNAGADSVVLCDTNGGTLVDELGKITEETVKFLKGKKVEIGIHCHNDSGLAVANTVEAVVKGCTLIHGTINGIGERTGNVDLCQVLPILAIKKNMPLPQLKLKDIKKVSELVNTLTNKKPNNYQPFVGRFAFSHKGGVHVDAMMKGASYEHINPALVGNATHTILSELSGKANVVGVLKEFGILVEKDDDKAIAMLNKVEEMERKGYDIGQLDAEKFLLKEDFFGKERFKILSWSSVSEQNNGERSECSLVGKVNGKKREALAKVECGPVDAMFHAVIKLLADNYKDVKKVRLLNYKVRIAEDKGAESSVRVYIEFSGDGKEWGTVGVSTNILEASIEALYKGFRYFISS